VGDVVRNDIGDGNFWTGQIDNVVNNTTFEVLLATGVFASVVQADGIENRGVTNTFSALSINASGGDIYAIQQGSGAFVGQEHVVYVDTDGTTPTLDATSRVRVDFGAGAQDTNIIGMGFDADDDLVAFNNDGTDANLINLSNPATHALNPNNSLPITTEDALNASIDAYALGNSGVNFVAYAYDTNRILGTGGVVDHYGMLYQNLGTVATFGIVDTGTGRFTQLQGAAQDTVIGTLLSSDIIGLAVDNATTGNIFVITAGCRATPRPGTRPWRALSITSLQ
jgi:hypothetical protein